MRIVILTGAGISAESGLRTFRDSGGLWEGHNVSDVATPEAFVRNPALVQRFYDDRRHQLSTVQPNAAHKALARLESLHDSELLLVTQNVDDLHERGGSKSVLHMHGELLSALCLSCGERFRWHATLADAPACPTCGQATLRPDIVWFGEMPYQMDVIQGALNNCDVFAAIGTSGQVYPAAGFVDVAAAAGARTIELNLTATAPDFTEHHEGPASATVPAWVDSLLRR